MARVELRNVSKTYSGGFQAVKDLSLTVEDKEFTVLVGPSGCGKSTTLRMIAGLEDISAGDIFIEDRRVNGLPPKDRDIAMVFQNYALYPHLTVFDNMAFGLKMRHYPKDEIRRRVHEAAEILGLTGLLSRRPKALSGGERQRVAVGRAIVRQPKVFLFDEPLSNLDAKLRVQMRAEIAKLHRTLQATMIYVTHDQVEAMTMGQRIVVMHEGVLQQAAPPLDLYHRPVNQFVAGFIGTPPMNFVPGVLEARDGALWFRARRGTFVLEIPLERRAALEQEGDREIVLGIRPEHFWEAPAPDRGIQAVVEVLELTGAETIAYLDAGGDTLAARIPAERHPGIGQPLTLDVDMRKVHFFSGATQQALL